MALGELDLAATITARLKERDWTQKQLFLEWHTASGGKLSSKTFEARLSNLMNDEEAGFTFILDGDDAPERLRALAACLAMPAADLEACLRTARSKPTLIFADDVEDRARRHFLVRAKRFPGLLQCVQPSADAKPTTRERLRDLATEHRNSIVVVTHERDRDFFAGAGVRVERIQTSGLGFRIDGVPEISLQTPARTVDTDGMPMLGDEPTEKKHRTAMTDRFHGPDPSRWEERNVSA